MKPLARHHDLICTEAAGELIIFDQRQKETHRLSPLLSVVYRHADGHTSVADLMAQARKELKRAVSKEMVFSALDQLSEAGLLAPPPSAGSRRAPTPPVDAAEHVAHAAQPELAAVA